MTTRCMCWSVWLLVSSCLLGAGGCTWERFNLFAPPAVPPSDAEGFVLRPDGLVPDKPRVSSEVDNQLAAARELLWKLR